MSQRRCSRSKKADAAKRVRIILKRGRRDEYNGVIGPQAGGLVDGPRVAPSQQDAGFGACDKEGAVTMQGVETLKVQIAPIHHVERASGFRQDPVKDIHVMQFSIGNLNESGDGATQVQQRMHLHRSLGGLKPSPRKDRQAQVNGRRVERIDGAIEIETERLRRVHRPGGCD